jgi:hypothetical protein
MQSVPSIGLPGPAGNVLTVPVAGDHRAGRVDPSSLLPHRAGQFRDMLARAHRYDARDR